MKQLFTITCTSHNARRIEKKHDDLGTIRWIGSPSFEKAQLFVVDGHVEILLELAANLEIENVKHIDTSEYTEPNSAPIEFEEEIEEAEELNDPSLEIEDMEEAQAEAKDLSGFDCDPRDPMADMSSVMREGNIKIHIWIFGEYTYTTYKFSSKAEALKEIRKNAKKGTPIKAYAGNAFRDREALKDLEN